MTANDDTPPSGENVSENRVESADGSDWEEAGRTLLRQRLQSVELRFHEALSEAAIKAKTGESLTVEDYRAVRTAIDDAEELAETIFEMTHQVEEEIDE